jgi:hypothetical protein
MLTRRDVMTGSLFGTLATGASAAPDEQPRDAAEMEKGLTAIKDELERIREVLDDGLVGPSLSHGRVGKVRGALEQYLKTNGRFPDYLEIGMTVFMDVYDWHVRYQQPLQLNRTTDNRIVIRFMLTQLIVRHEQDGNFVGPPYDRPA